MSSVLGGGNTTCNDKIILMVIDSFGGGGGDFQESFFFHFARIKRRFSECARNGASRHGNIWDKKHFVISTSGKGGSERPVSCVVLCRLKKSGLSSGVSPRYFYCGKITVIYVQAVTVIKHNCRYRATHYREKRHLPNTVQNFTDEFIISRYCKTNYRAKSGVPAISGYRR